VTFTSPTTGSFSTRALSEPGTQAGTFVATP
jgi:hypothetical protein